MQQNPTVLDYEHLNMKIEKGMKAALRSAARSRLINLTSLVTLILQQWLDGEREKRSDLLTAPSSPDVRAVQQTATRDVKRARKRKSR